MPKYKVIAVIEYVDYLQAEIEIEADNSQQANAIVYGRMKNTDDLESYSWTERDSPEWQMETLAIDGVVKIEENKEE